MKQLSAAIALFVASYAQSADWQDVRIVDKPEEDCVFKRQEVCKYDNIDCLNWFKERAAKNGSNTVVLPVLSVPYGLADYYHCPSRGPEQI